MKFFIKTVIIIPVLYLSGCNSLKINVINVREASGIKSNGIIYSLPRTILRIKTETIKVTTIPGPYYKYAEKFLGITNVPNKTEEKWYLTDINAFSYAEADSNHCYLVSSKGLPIADLIYLSSEGFIYGINMKEAPVFTEPVEPIKNIQVKNKYIETDYLDLSVKNYVEEKIKTSYKRIRRDSNYVRIPVEKKQVTEKNMEDKAREAADFIFKLRKRRFKMLAGVADAFPDGKGLTNNKFPDGESIRYMDTELDALEQEYLSLFIGKIFSDTITYNFDFTPDEVNSLTPSVIFRFSPIKGILNSNDILGDPVYLAIKKGGKNTAIDQFIFRQREFISKKKETGIVYRIPDYANMKILLNENTLYEDKFLIAQYGTVLSLPADIVKDSEYSIQFYPKYGNIKFIHKY